MWLYFWQVKSSRKQVIAELEEKLRVLQEGLGLQEESAPDQQQLEVCSTPRLLCRWGELEYILASLSKFESVQIVCCGFSCHPPVEQTEMSDLRSSIERTKRDTKSRLESLQSQKNEWEAWLAKFLAYQEYLREKSRHEVSGGDPYSVPDFSFYVLVCIHGISSLPPRDIWFSGP